MACGWPLFSWVHLHFFLEFKNTIFLLIVGNFIECILNLFITTLHHNSSLIHSLPPCPLSSFLFSFVFNNEKVQFVLECGAIHWRADTILGVTHLRKVTHSVGCHFVLLTVSFALQKIFSFIMSRVLIVDSLHYWYPVQETVSCANAVNAISLFLFCQVHCNWIYAEVFYLLGLEFGEGW